MGRLKWTALPTKRISPWLGRKIAGDDLDQRRLAGAVVAHQADHLARQDLHVDVMQRADRAELLADAGQLQDRCRLQRFVISGSSDVAVDQGFQIFLPSRARLRIEAGAQRTVGKFGERALAGENGPALGPRPSVVALRERRR